MSRPAWYRRYPRYFLSDARGLGPEAVGAYAVLIDLVQIRGEPIAADYRYFGRVFGCSTRRARTLVGQLVEAGKINRLDDDRLMWTRPKSVKSHNRDRSTVLPPFTAKKPERAAMMVRTEPFDHDYGKLSAEIAHLTADERRVYRTLVNHCWRYDVPLPPTDDHIATLCGISVGRWRSMKPHILQMCLLGLYVGKGQHRIGICTIGPVQ